VSVKKLSEAKNRFRIRNGEIEIEYEGPLNEVNKRYDKALEWLASQPAKATVPKKKEFDEREKEDKRGGLRKPIYGPKIDELESEGFFKKRKSLDEVVKGLVTKNVPTKGHKARNAILMSLRRRIAQKNAKLKGATEEDQWYFWTD
jgi:hypothetical protein